MNSGASALPLACCGELQLLDPFPIQIPCSFLHENLRIYQNAQNSAIPFRYEFGYIYN